VSAAGRIAPNRVAAAGRVSGDVEQILGRKGQTGERPVLISFDAQPRTGNKRIDVVRHDKIPIKRDNLLLAAPPRARSSSPGPAGNASDDHAARDPAGATLGGGCLCRSALANRSPEAQIKIS